MLNPLKPKYFPLYWRMAFAAAEESVATRHKVGAVVVLPSGMISIGWNGMPAKLENECEFPHYTLERGHHQKTKPEVIHAERNAIDKMTREGVSTNGAILFVTRSPCFECAKALHGLGLSAIYYAEPHDCLKGLALLEKTGTPVYAKNS